MTESATATRRWGRRIALIAVTLTLIVFAATGALFLFKSHQRQSQINGVAARACSYPTDAAARRYVSRQAAATGVNYIQTLETMYRRCPNRGVATTRPRRRRSTAGVFAAHRHPPTKQRSGEGGDNENDGGD
jgi:hypothetical protein